MLILVLQPPKAMPSDSVERIQSVVPSSEVLISTDWELIRPRANEVTVAAGYRPFELLQIAPNLRWFQQFSAGSDWLQSYPEYQVDSYVLTHASGIHPIQITEHVFGTLLSLTHHLDKSHMAQQNREWFRPPYPEVEELYGKTMLIVGIGAIGKRVANVARAFGMNTIGIRRNPDRPEPSVDSVRGSSDLHEVLPLADIVVVTVPRTAETYHMFSAREFELMKPSSFLVNVGRGDRRRECSRRCPSSWAATRCGHRRV